MGELTAQLLTGLGLMILPYQTKEIDMSDPKPLTNTPDLIAAAAILEAAYHSKFPGFLPLLTA